MSFLDDLIDTVVDAGKAAFSSGGGGGGSVTVSPSQATDVQVNPNITAVNVIETGPLADLLDDIRDEDMARADAAAEREAALIGQLSDLRLWLAGGALLLAISRKGSAT